MGFREWPESERLAYLGGLIDGEGWIGITCDRRRPLATRYTLSVQLSMSEPAEAVRLLHEELGGSLAAYGQDKPMLRWSIASSNAERALTRVQPWLVVKSEQAANGLRFQRARDAGDVDESFWEIARNLNARQAVMVG